MTMVYLTNEQDSALDVFTKWSVDPDLDADIAEPIRGLAWATLIALGLGHWRTKPLRIEMKKLPLSRQLPDHIDQACHVWVANHGATEYRANAARSAAQQDINQCLAGNFAHDKKVFRLEPWSA